MFNPFIEKDIIELIANNLSLSETVKFSKTNKFINATLINQIETKLKENTAALKITLAFKNYLIYILTLDTIGNIYFSNKYGIKQKIDIILNIVKTVDKKYYCSDSHISSLIGNIIEDVEEYMYFFPPHIRLVNSVDKLTDFYIEYLR